MAGSAFLTKIGTALPSYSYDQLELADWMADRIGADAELHRKFKVLYKMTRIGKRHSVLPDFSPKNKKAVLFNGSAEEPSVEKRMAVYQSNVLDLSISAIQNTIPRSEDLAGITHLITVSCTGLSAPGLELQLKEKLAFSPGLQTHAVNFVGCYAFFPALKMAEAFVKVDPNAKVLIVATEICTIHFQNSEEEDHLLSNSLFADGAAACLVEGEMGARASGRGGDEWMLELKNTAQLHFPRGKKDMAWDIHSKGFLMKLSSYVPDLVNEGIGKLVDQLLEKVDQINAIQHWAIHPGGRKILEVCTQELNLKNNQLSASYKVLEQVGNLSAPTILFVLKELWMEAKEDENLFACGFGPGLTLDGALFKWVKNA